MPTPDPSVTSRSRSSCTTPSMPRTESVVDGLPTRTAAAWLDALGAASRADGAGVVAGAEELVALRDRGARRAAVAVAGEPARAPPSTRSTRERAGAPLARRRLAADGAAEPHRHPRRAPRRRRHRRAGRRRDRVAHRAAARRPAGVRRARLRPAVPQGPPAPRVVLERLRQPRPPGPALPPLAHRLLDSA